MSPFSSPDNLKFTKVTLHYYGEGYRVTGLYQCRGGLTFRLVRSCTVFTSLFLERITHVCVSDNILIIRKNRHIRG